MESIRKNSLEIFNDFKKDTNVDSLTIRPKDEKLKHFKGVSIEYKFQKSLFRKSLFKNI